MFDSGFLRGYCSVGGLMDHIARIEQQLDSFPDTLTLYRQQLKHWFSQAADTVSRATDMPSLMDMERVIKLGNTSTVVSSGDDDFFSTVAQCPQGEKFFKSRASSSRCMTFRWGTFRLM
jgi:hypothetical protein